nr:hypothetical protein [Oxalobacteraceae bacterium]
MEVDEFDHVVDHQFFVSDRAFYMGLADLGRKIDATDHGQHKAGHLGGLIDFNRERIKFRWIGVNRNPATQVDWHITAAIEQQLTGMRMAAGEAERH